MSTALHPHTGRPTVFVHDGHPGGAGFAERGHAVLRPLAGGHPSRDRRLRVPHRLPVVRAVAQVRQRQRPAGQGGGGAWCWTWCSSAAAPARSSRAVRGSRPPPAGPVGGWTGRRRPRRGGAGTWGGASGDAPAQPQFWGACLSVPPAPPSGTALSKRSSVSSRSQRLSPIGARATTSAPLVRRIVQRTGCRGARPGSTAPPSARPARPTVRRRSRSGRSVDRDRARRALVPEPRRRR